MSELRVLLSRQTQNVLNLLDRDRAGSNSDYILYRLDCLVYHLNHYSPLLELDDTILATVREARTTLFSSEEHSLFDFPYAYKADLAFSGAAGRPSYSITREHLLFFLDHRFTIPEIAGLLGVSPSTVKRRLRLFGLSVSASYCTKTNQELDEIVSEILTDFPNCGYKRMTGFLLSRGLRIQQTRIRESMRRVDPEGVLLRALQLNTVNRREYSVYSPLALWHIDTNHKLIR